MALPLVILSGANSAAPVSGYLQILVGHRRTPFFHYTKCFHPVDYHNCTDAFIWLYWIGRCMNAENYRYQFVAGNLALDFINTVVYRLDPEKVRDHLQSAADVRQWATQAHLPDRDAISSCRPLSKIALLHARAVREQLFSIFRAIASDEPVPPDALRRVGNAL